MLLAVLYQLCNKYFGTKTARKQMQRNTVSPIIQRERDDQEASKGPARAEWGMRQLHPFALTVSRGRRDLRSRLVFQVYLCLARLKRPPLCSQRCWGHRPREVGIIPRHRRQRTGRGT